MNLDSQSAEQVIDWRWVAQARLAALRMQSISDEARMQAALVARTTMIALTADHTPIGRSPLVTARTFAEELAEAYPAFEASAFHCASLLFFFDLIDAKYYHDIGLPPEFWSFGDLVSEGIGFHPRPPFSAIRATGAEGEADEWVVERADRVRRALALIAGGAWSKDVYEEWTD